MAMSTMANPSGNLSGPDQGALLLRDAQYGVIVFDGGHASLITQQPQPPDDLCRYAITLELQEEQAKAVKAVNPNTHV